MEVLGRMKWDDESSSSAIDLKDQLGLALKCRERGCKSKAGKIISNTDSLLYNAEQKVLR